MSDTTLWWITLGVGLVVAVVVVVLLQTFYLQVRRIERGAEAIWHTGKQTAANTATTWMLGVTGDKLDALGAEVQRHAELLQRGGDER